MLYESDPLSVAWHSGPKCQGQCQKNKKKEQNRKIKGAWCDILVRRMPYFISIAKSVMLQRFMGAVTMPSLSFALYLSLSLAHAQKFGHVLCLCHRLSNTTKLRINTEKYSDQFQMHRVR